MDISKRICWFFYFLAVDRVIWRSQICYAVISWGQTRSHMWRWNHSLKWLHISLLPQAEPFPMSSQLSSTCLTSLWTYPHLFWPKSEFPFLLPSFILYFFLLFLLLLSSSTAAVFPLLLSPSFSFFLSFHSYLTHFLPHPVLSVMPFSHFELINTPVFLFTFSSLLSLTFPPLLSQSLPQSPAEAQIPSASLTPAEGNSGFSWTPCWQEKGVKAPFQVLSFPGGGGLSS